jgi:hypothetical protein
MSGAVVIRRCASAEEAAIVCALLNDADIPASLENWHHAMIHWGVLPALGGVGVHVPAGMAEPARRVIIEYVESAEERLETEFPDLENIPLPPRRWRQAILIGYYTGLLLIPFIIAFMLADMVSRARSVSTEGAFAWPVLLSEVRAAYWGDLAIWCVDAALSFVVPLAILVLLARRFLARRAAMKVDS